MVFCTQCGNALVPTHIFCTSCGTACNSSANTSLATAIACKDPAFATQSATVIQSPQPAVVNRDGPMENIYKCKFCDVTFTSVHNLGQNVADQRGSYICPLIPGCYWRQYECRKCGRRNEEADGGDGSHICKHCHNTSQVKHPWTCVALSHKTLEIWERID